MPSQQTLIRHQMIHDLYIKKIVKNSDCTNGYVSWTSVMAWTKSPDQDFVADARRWKKHRLR